MPNLVKIGQTVAEIFSHFQDGGRRHLWFLVFEIITARTLTRVELRRLA